MSNSTSRLFSAELSGINARLVEVEADVSAGLHSFTLVGLADTAVKEAKERVNSALKSSNVQAPSRENRRVTINLAPANIKKSGSHFDLPIALVYMCATDQLRIQSPLSKMFLGELALDGTVRPVTGVLNFALCAKEKGLSEIFVPEQNADEAAIVPGMIVYPVINLTELVQHLEQTRLITHFRSTSFKPAYRESDQVLTDIQGLHGAKRALLIAAAGGHNILLHGAPGTGKTMLASSLASLLPPPSEEEIIEINQIYSAAGLTLRGVLLKERPFRNPHHSTSPVAVIGGGSDPRPGEISLAHRGVLFLDEVPEFHRDVLESLRQPMETGEVHVSRAKGSQVFPARTIFVFAMNPCPCGYLGDDKRDCDCAPGEIRRYVRKISGPLLDRIDMHVRVTRAGTEDMIKSLNAAVSNSSSEELHAYRQKVCDARALASLRSRDFQLHAKLNGELKSKDLSRVVNVESAAKALLSRLLDDRRISGRGYHRLLRVALTIRDLENCSSIKESHVLEAYQYRALEN